MNALPLFGVTDLVTGDEADRLLALEVTIERGLTTFVEVGAALLEIRDSRLYRTTHSTFEDYCRDRWEMNVRYANRIIAAAEVTRNLGPAGPILPATERQARPLAGLEPDDQRAAWQRVLDTAPNGKITAAHVTAAAAEIRRDVIDKRAEREAAREQRRQDNAAKAADAPDPLAVNAKFATILLDPPWDWGDEGDVNQLGRAKPDYSTMAIDDLLQLPVPDLADDDCHIYLWITNRSLPKGFVLLERWGFRYITCLTWVKPHFGMGNYFRGQTEHILFGVKGSQMLKRKDAGTVFHADRGPNGHSSKPPEIYELIESCSPGPYLEMFARTQRDGWHRWGADAE